MIGPSQEEVPDRTAEDEWRHENHLLQERCNDLTHANERLREENAKLREQLAGARRKRNW